MDHVTLREAKFKRASSGYQHLGLCKAKVGQEIPI